METSPQFAHLTKRLRQIPGVVWFLGLGLVIALAAVLVFKVAIGTGVSYGLFTVMMGSHFFMYGAHGHSASAEPTHPPATAARSDSDQAAGHAGGCH